MAKRKAVEKDESSLEHNDKALKSDHHKKALPPILRLDLPDWGFSESAQKRAFFTDLVLSVVVGDVEKIRDLIKQYSSYNVNEIVASIVAQTVPETFICYEGTILHIAALRNKPNIIKLLLAAGADKSKLDGYKKTALEIAKEKGYLEVVKELSGMVEDTPTSATASSDVAGSGIEWGDYWDLS